VIRSSRASSGVHLRLVWPQWQGGGASSVRLHAPQFPFDVARRGYAVGAVVLEAVLPAHDGPTVAAPVTMTDEGHDLRNGVEARRSWWSSSPARWSSSSGTTPARITTLEGECSVSVAPFSELARRYRDDLAIVWPRMLRYLTMRGHRLSSATAVLREFRRRPRSRRQRAQ